MEARGRISVADTRCAHADVIGSEALRGKLLGSGPILKKIDMLVAEIARIVAQRTVVTVAFDTFKLLRPVFHGDFVRLEGRALSINSSSIVCQASVYRRDFATGEFQLTHNAIVTFVALDKSGRPSGGLPELFDPQRPVQCQQLRDIATKRKELSTRWRKAQEDVTALAMTQPITHDMIPVLDSDAAAPARKVNIQDTVIETRNNFLLKHANLNRNVFGGVLLDWMDRAALYCARNFTKNYNMVTVGMNRVHFKLPINLDNLVSIRSRVCRVKKFSVEIEIAVYRVELPHNVQKLSHTGYFEVLNLEEDNRRREIHIGVTASEADQEGMAALMRACRRQQFEQEDAELLSMPPIPVALSSKFVDDSPRSSL